MECNEGICPSEPEGPPESTSDEEQPTECRRVKVRLSLFFDGTLNNRVNVTHGKTAGTDAKSAAVMARIRAKDKTESSSYFNEYSNVSRLEEQLKRNASGYDYYFRVYTEGIGTVDSSFDSAPGKITGRYSTGVAAKVANGLAQAIKQLITGLPKNVIIELLSVDTFGFSRGAAAARYCAYRVLHSERVKPYEAPRLPLRDRLSALGRTVERVELDTVGIFETVSALGNAYIDKSDVDELKLNSVREARAVLHLVASEEYRRCFSATNIKSAVQAGVGHEIYLPGAHSDVGGGYVDRSREEQVIWVGTGSASLEAFLRDNGWYRDAELQYRNESVGRRNVEDVRASRSSISLEYSFLPLRGMADFATERGLPVKSTLYEVYDPVNVPAAVRARVESCLTSRKPNKPADWQTNDPSLRALRHDFLHFSSHEDWGHDMRTVELDRAKRVQWPCRKVFDG